MWFAALQDESEGQAVSNIVSPIVSAIRTNTLEEKVTINLSDYRTTDAEYGVNVQDWRHLDFGGDNKFDVSLKINTLLPKKDKNELKIASYSEREFSRKYGTVDGMCTTLDFEYENRNIIGLELAIPNAQKQKFKDYLFAALIAVISEKADSALDAGETWNPTSYACNNAVRAFVYYLKSDAVLFPGCDPDKPTSCGSGLTCAACAPYLKGSVNHPGRANDIYDSFEDGELDEYFEEIEKGSTETWKDFFDDIQTKANSGEIIIGVIKESGHGHIVAFMPSSLYTGTNDIVKIGEDENVTKPIALEAGGDVKEIKPFVGSDVKITRSTNPYKYYKYTK